MNSLNTEGNNIIIMGTVLAVIRMVAVPNSETEDERYLKRGINTMRELKRIMMNKQHEDIIKALREAYNEVVSDDYYFQCTKDFPGGWVTVTNAYSPRYELTADSVISVVFENEYNEPKDND